MNPGLSARAPLCIVLLNDGRRVARNVGGFLGGAHRTVADPRRRAIILCGGDKSGGNEKRFYRQLIARADDRFDVHLALIKKQKERKRRP